MNMWEFFDANPVVCLFPGIALIILALGVNIQFRWSSKKDDNDE
jgi:ABC-type dipeptide/oligopeptide/nickel transport system permease subunit